MYYPDLSDLWSDAYLISKADVLEEYYLKSFDEEKNLVTWTPSVNQARQYQSRQEAESVGNTINRPYMVVDHQVCIF